MTGSVPSPRGEGQGLSAEACRLAKADEGFVKLEQTKIMRRFSQRNPLVTLSEINITPLLDLAFVLLIIFVITTPLLEQGLTLQLPGGGTPDRPLEPKDIKTVEASPQGFYLLDGKPMDLRQLETALVNEHRRNPRMVVFIRGDERYPLKVVADVLNVMERNGITRVSLRTDPMKDQRGRR